mgnify:CR=1 FL=1
MALWELISIYPIVNPPGHIPGKFEWHGNDISNLVLNIILYQFPKTHYTFYKYQLNCRISKVVHLYDHYNFSELNNIMRNHGTSESNGWLIRLPNNTQQDNSGISRQFKNTPLQYNSHTFTFFQNQGNDYYNLFRCT